MQSLQPPAHSLLVSLLLQGNKQVTRAAIEWYGPDRAKWLGAHPRFVLPFSLLLRLHCAHAFLLHACHVGCACRTSLLWQC